MCIPVGTRGEDRRARLPGYDSRPAVSVINYPVDGVADLITDSIGSLRRA